MTNCTNCGESRGRHNTEFLYCPYESLDVDNISTATQYKKPRNRMERYYASRKFDQMLAFIGVSRKDFNLLVHELVNK